MYCFTSVLIILFAITDWSRSLHTKRQQLCSEIERNLIWFVVSCCNQHLLNSTIIRITVNVNIHLQGEIGLSFTIDINLRLIEIYSHQRFRSNLILYICSTELTLWWFLECVWPIDFPIFPILAPTICTKTVTHELWNKQKPSLWD